MTHAMWRRIGSLALMAFLLTAAPQTYADCREQEEALQRDLQRELTKLGDPQNTCAIARQTIPVVQKALRFYESCPIADPQGQMHQYLEGMLQSLDQMSHVCE